MALTIENQPVYGDILDGIPLPARKTSSIVNKPMETAITAAPETGAALAPENRLDTLYAQLEKTQPGSEESKRIAEQIVDAIG